MKLITSRDNPSIKALHKRVAGAGKRGAAVLLEGVHLCQAWLMHYGEPEQALFDADRLHQPELAALARAVSETHSLALSGHLLRGLEHVDSSQGVAFVVQPPLSALPESVTENCVFLDRIQDPGNVGTLLRTCAAVGIRQVFLAPGTAAAWSPKVLRSGQGAHFALDVHEHVDANAWLSRLQVPLAVTTLDTARDVFSTPLPRAVAWVFGHEGGGVDAMLLAHAALRLRISHEAAVESLNVGVAAAICLFEQRRQHLLA